MPSYTPDSSNMERSNTRNTQFGLPRLVSSKERTPNTEDNGSQVNRLRKRTFHVDDPAQKRRRGETTTPESNLDSSPETWTKHLELVWGKDSVMISSRNRRFVAVKKLCTTKRLLTLKHENILELLNTFSLPDFQYFIFEYEFEYEILNRDIICVTLA